MQQTAYIIANFGGPRTLNEIEPFLQALLTDKEVIRTQLPQVFHNYLFGRVAKKRAKQITPDYKKIGGGSPIWADTEFIAAALREKLHSPVLTFHRYLPATHPSFIDEIERLDCDEYLVFPMFPQFTYATTGSIARFFSTHLSGKVLSKIRWVKSYPAHPAYLKAMASLMNCFLNQRGLSEEEVFFLFSAHGLPQNFVDKGDLYAYECRFSFKGLMNYFPRAEGMLCYQSKFGPGEWLKPYTIDVCESIENYCKGRSYCVFVPMSFTSDHIETLFEIEEQYMPVIEKRGRHPFRAPAMNRHPHWIDAICHIISDSTPCTTHMLLR